MPCLPAKLLYAARLAEHGLLPAALQYVGLVQAALGGVPSAKLPPGLAVARALAGELEERLRTHATVGLHCLSCHAFTQDDGRLSGRSF